MTTLRYDSGDNEPELTVDLRDHRIAALLAWLWPGAGHFYQHRYAKGFIFMICVLGTFFFGLRVGNGRVVYASFRPGDFRWQYLCQAGVGLPALPAVIQVATSNKNGSTLWTMCHRYPADYLDKDKRLVAFQRVPADQVKALPRTIRDGFMAPPAPPILPNDNDVLGMWHAELGNWFEIGTFYTVIAGLLNLLAVYDAFAGPVIMRRVTPALPD